MLSEAIMIARIRTESGFCDSAVFAIYDYKDHAEALVLDREGQHLKRVSFTSIIGRGIRIDVFIFDMRAENWVKKGNNEGYAWPLGHEDEEEILKRCKKMSGQCPTHRFFPHLIQKVPASSKDFFE